MDRREFASTRRRTAAVAVALLFIPAALVAQAVAPEAPKLDVEDIGLDLPEMGVLAYPIDRESAAILPEAPRRKAAEAA